MDEALEIAYEPTRSRVEGRRDGVPTGFVEFGLRARSAVLAYTEVTDRDSAALVGGALRLLRVRGFDIVPLCPRVRAYLADHPEQLAGVDVRFLDARDGARGIPNARSADTPDGWAVAG